MLLLNKALFSRRLRHGVIVLVPFGYHTMIIAIGTSDTLFMIIPVFIQSVTAVFKLTDIDIKESITHTRDQRTVVCTGFRHRQSVTLIQQMPCLYGDITACGLYGA